MHGLNRRQGEKEERDKAKGGVGARGVSQEVSPSFVLLKHQAAQRKLIIGKLVPV